MEEKNKKDNMIGKEMTAEQLQQEEKNTQNMLSENQNIEEQNQQQEAPPEMPEELKLNEILQEQIAKVVDELMELPTNLAKSKLQKDIKTIKELYWIIDEISKREPKIKTIRLIPVLRKQKQDIYEEKIKELNLKIEEAKQNNDEETRKKLIEEKEKIDNYASLFTYKYNQLYETLQEHKKQLEENTKRKEELLQRLKDIIFKGAYLTGKDIREVRNIRNKWKNIGQVLPSKYKAIKEAYSTYMQQFYELQKRLIEARKEDEERNFQIKSEIIEDMKALLEKAKTLTKWNDWRDKIRVALLNLEDLWQETGEVPKNKEFIEKEYRKIKKELYAIQDKLREEKEKYKRENLKKQLHIIEELDKIVNEELDKIENVKEFYNLKNKVHKLYEQHKRIFPIPQNDIDLVKDKVRELMQKFYEKTDKFSEEVEAERKKRLEKKQELFEQAKSILENEELTIRQKKNEIEKIRKRWFEETGRNDFSEAFKLYEQFKKLMEELNKQYVEYIQKIKAEFPKNLEKKQELIKRLEEAQRNVEDPEELRKILNEVIQEWKQIGEVPREQKAKLHDRLFRTIKYIFYLRLFPDKAKRKGRKLFNEEVEKEIFKTRLQIIMASPNPLNKLKQERQKVYEKRRREQEKIRKIEKTLNTLQIDDPTGVFKSQMEARKNNALKRKEMYDEELKYINEAINQLLNDENQEANNTQEPSQQEVQNNKDEIIQENNSENSEE